VGWSPSRRCAAGGLLGNPNLHRRQLAPSGEEAERTLLRWVFAGDSLRRGDVLVVSSVSGTSARVVELALAAREAALLVVALTAPVSEAADLIAEAIAVGRRILVFGASHAGLLA